MFALGIEFLMGRAMMTRWGGDRDEPEWPPHPDRVFMSLVAAWGETGEDPAEQAALQWLETLGAPQLHLNEVTSHRTSFTSFVPVNDDWKRGIDGSPMGNVLIGRSRQPRMYPTTTPQDPVFHLIWPDVELQREHETAMERICSQVTCLGHSASPVRMWIEREPKSATHFPTRGRASFRLRSFAPGRLAYLKSRFAAQLRPQPSSWTGYEVSREVTTEERAIVAGPYDPSLLVFRWQGGRKLVLESCSMIADAMRNTLMSRMKTDIPEWLGGHAADGSPSRLRRPVYLPLGFVDHNLTYADGHLLGLAIAIPADFPAAAYDLLIDLLIRHGEPEEVVSPHTGFVRLWMIDPLSLRFAGEACFEMDDRPPGQRATTLQPVRWTRASDRWNTVTPIVLPRFPRRELTAEEVIAQACVEAGYPPPVSVRVGHAPFLCGVAHARSFPRVPRKSGQPERLRMHAEITFAEQVQGPMIIGAGRYKGFGFCYPVPDKEP